MAPRYLSLALALLGFSGLTVTVACGGGDGKAPEVPGTETAAPSSTPRPRESRSFEPAASTPTATRSASSAETSVPTGPEGAVPRITTRSRVTSEGDAPGTSNGVSFVAPLDYWETILEPFGKDLGGGLFHGGIDFGLDGHPNAPIYAACTGWVAGVLKSDAYGTYIVVKCGDSSWTTVYAQLGETLVRLNDTVTAGKTVIARSGGPAPWGHEMLHFELRWDFVPVDPAIHIALNVRPSFTIPATPTPTPSPTSTPAQQGGGAEPGLVPSAPTPTPTATPTPTPTPWYNPTATPTVPAPTPTRIPTRTPTPTPTLPAPTSTPVPPPQAF